MKAAHLNDRGAVCSVSKTNGMVKVVYRGREHCLKHSRGMEYLLVLMRHPGMPVPLRLLETLDSGVADNYRQYVAEHEVGSAGMHYQEGFPSIPMADLSTIRNIKHRLIELVEKIAVLEEYCDYGRLEELYGEKEKLELYLKEVYLPGYGIRKFTDEQSLMRKRILKAIRRALAQIGSVEPELAGEIRRNLHLDQWLMYRPGEVEIDV